VLRCDGRPAELCQNRALAVLELAAVDDDRPILGAIEHGGGDALLAAKADRQLALSAGAWVLCECPWGSGCADRQYRCECECRQELAECGLCFH